MSYVIRGEGYEYRGFKLGQSVMYNGEIRKIIGFDERRLNINYFILLEGVEPVAFAWEAITSILEEFKSIHPQNTIGAWAKQDDMSIIDDLSDDQLPQEISEAHAIEILEDIIKDEFIHEYFFGNDEGRLYSCYTQEQMNVIKQCIEILKAK